jgi:hypothetical protein
MKEYAFTFLYRYFHESPELFEQPNAPDGYAAEGLPPAA